LIILITSCGLAICKISSTQRLPGRSGDIEKADIATSKNGATAAQGTQYRAARRLQRAFCRRNPNFGASANQDGTKSVPIGAIAWILVEYKTRSSGF
jgi:hypothetical protein